MEIQYTETEEDGKTLLKRTDDYGNEYFYSKNNGLLTISIEYDSGSLLKTTYEYY